MTPANAGAAVVSLVEEWIGRLGSPVDEASLGAWFAERAASGNDLISGPACDGRVGLLQVGLSGGLLSRVYLDLAAPVPAQAFRDRHGEGRTVYGVDATHETVLWTLAGARGQVTVTADMLADGQLERISLLGP